MHKLTRICYNSNDWQRPSGDARKTEAAKTFNHDFGFGHEEWLFRAEWTIDGWRYAYLQGVKKSRAKLVKAAQPFDLMLFTILPDKRRRIVATLRNVECLDDQQAAEALAVFKKQGWYGTMLDEIREVGGNPHGSGPHKPAILILNVRFRQEAVIRFPARTFVPRGHPIERLSRYQLCDAGTLGSSDATPRTKHRAGASDLPRILPFLRKGTTAIRCTPEHARLQARLMEELKTEYPDFAVVREEDFIDVSVRTKQELILYEIKSDLDPRRVLRAALGQILEYAFHPSRQHPLPVRLVIVGRKKLSTDDAQYLDRLKNEFGLPLEYRVVALM